MKNYKMQITYDGSNYHGWQKQENTKQTIQGILEKKLQEIFKQKLEIQGSGRTDAGTHANQQVANFHIQNEFVRDEFLKTINTILPDDIKVNEITKVDDKFHSRLSVVSKEYIYYIDLGEKADVFTRKYKYHYPHKIDCSKMEEAKKHFLGTHDFRSFTSDKRKEKSCIRTIYDIQIERERNQISVRIHGNGFLYNMVRIIVGTLLEVGRGSVEVSEIENIMEAKERINAGQTLPSNGLFLNKVFY
jgi:pseudouridylate synthase I